MSVVPPYTSPQQSEIDVASAPQAQEDGPSAMPPNPYPAERQEEWLPPPVKQTDIFTAQQTYPL